MPKGHSELYPALDIAKVMERKRIDLGLTVDAAAELAGMNTKWSWYDKAQGRSAFSLAEISSFAAAIDAPRGWPFIEWSAAKWLAAQIGDKS